MLPFGKSNSLLLSSHLSALAATLFLTLHLRMPPHSNCDDFLTTLRSGLWKLHYQLCKEGRARFFKEFYPLLNNTKAKVLSSWENESWYLVYIGTRPSARGKGYARKSIEYVTKMADAAGYRCYLESSNPVNPAIYRRLGFDMIEKIALLRGEKIVAMDVMVRTPQWGSCEEMMAMTKVINTRERARVAREKARSMLMGKWEYTAW